MKKQRSAGAVVFYEAETGREFLLLETHQKNAYWDLPKGRIEEDENALEAARREIKEESGLSVTFIDGFVHTLNYKFRWNQDLISKEVTFFLARVNTQQVTVSGEHKGFIWLPFSKAVKTVTYKNQKVLLQAANDFLDSQT